MTQGVCEIMWLRKINGRVMCLYCDNKVVIRIAHNPIQYDGAKHVEIDQYFKKKKIKQWDSGYFSYTFKKSAS